MDLNAHLKLLLPDAQLPSLNLPLLLSKYIVLVGEIWRTKKRRSAKTVKLPSVLLWVFYFGVGSNNKLEAREPTSKTHTCTRTQTHTDNLMCSSFDASAATFDMCDCWFAGGTVSLKSASDSVLFFSCLFLGRFSLGTCLDRQTNRQRAYCFFTI